MTSMFWEDLLGKAEEGGTFTVMPDGEYPAEVTKAEAKNAKSSGKPMIVATMKVIEGPFAGRLLWNNFVVSDDNAIALGWFFRNLATFGLDKSFFMMNPSLDQVAAALVGRKAILTVGSKKLNGEDRNEVKGFKQYVPDNAATMAAPFSRVSTNGGPAVVAPDPVINTNGDPAPAPQQPNLPF